MNLKGLGAFGVLLIAAFAVAVLFLLEKRPDAEIPQTSREILEKLEAAESFKYYLDKGNPQIGEKMQEMDLVIEEPLEMEQKYIKTAQASGTLVYGYINSMEADKWNKKPFAKFTDYDFYRDKNGERIYFRQ